MEEGEDCGKRAEKSIFFMKCKKYFMTKKYRKEKGKGENEWEKEINDNNNKVKEVPIAAIVCELNGSLIFEK